MSATAAETRSASAAISSPTGEEPWVVAARERQLELIMQGDRPRAVAEATTLLAGGVPLEDFVLGVLAPVQAEVGLRWQDGRISAAHERMATDTADQLLTLAANRNRHVVTGSKFVLCVADHEHHNLPARMIAELLRHQGHGVTFLGSARPKPGLERLLKQLDPDALVVSCSLAMNLPGVVGLAGAAHNVGLPVVVGGAAFAGRSTRALRVGADGLATRVGEVAPRTQESRGTAWAERPGDERAAQWAALTAGRRQLAGELTERLLRQALGLLPRALRQPEPLERHVENLLRFVEAATLVEDQVLEDYVGWLNERLGTLRADPRLVSALLEMLSDRLRSGAPAAAAATRALAERS